MKTIITLFLVSLATHCFAVGVTTSAGYGLSELSATMKYGKYEEVELDVAPIDPKYGQKIWAVEKGYIIATYLKSGKKVSSLTFYVCDDKAKDKSKGCSFDVKKFNVKTGEMVLQMTPIWKKN